MTNNNSKRVRAYENAVDAMILDGMADSEMRDHHITIANVATEIDDVVRRIAENARNMAERFAAYADQVEAGRAATPPTGYSTLPEIERDAVRRDLKIEQLYTLVRLMYGQDKVKALRAEIARVQNGGAK